MSKYKKWTGEELFYILSMYKHTTDKNMAKILSSKFGCNITVNMVRRQRRNLKIRKLGGRPLKRTL